MDASPLWLDALLSPLIYREWAKSTVCVPTAVYEGFWMRRACGKPRLSRPLSRDRRPNAPWLYSPPGQLRVCAHPGGREKRSCSAASNRRSPGRLDKGSGIVVDAPLCPGESKVLAEVPLHTYSEK